MSTRAPFSQRHECKFVIPESIAARVLEAAEAFLEPDAHAARRPDHTYPISSLYLDAPHLPLYRETVEGLRTRFKLRVRTYTDAPATPIFLEVKRRLNGIVTKMRFPLPRTALGTVLAGEVSGFDHIVPAKCRALHEFVRLMTLRAAIPRLLVRYDRQAYVGRGDDEVRVTFDRRLRTMPTERAAVVIDHPSYRQVSMTGVVLELKFTDRCPGWMMAIIRRFRTASPFVLEVRQLRRFDRHDQTLITLMRPRCQTS